MKRVFIVWERYNRRAELFAQHLGAEVFYISYGQKGKRLHALMKYPAQALKTIFILRRERPSDIFVQNPPIFCALLVCLYSQLWRTQFVIDSHTGAFLSPAWRWSLGLHRWLSRRARVTVVHNVDQEQIVKRWGCRYSVLGFTPGDYPTGATCSLAGQFKIAVISTFVSDEPLAVIVNAAANIPEVCFYITGDSKRMPQSLLARKPENCHLTGYLTYEQYVGLLRGVDVVMDLTIQDHTLLMGGFEAVSVGKPLITSDWPVLKNYFSLGTVHIPNTVQGILEGVRRVQREQDVLQQGILCLREQLQVEWARGFSDLQHMLRADQPGIPEQSA